MQSAFHVTTKVLPGNKIEVELPPGSEGQDVTVFVVSGISSAGKRFGAFRGGPKTQNWYDR